MKTSLIAIILIAASGLLRVSAGESKILAEAGLNLPAIEVPAPETPKSNQWLTLRKIQVNTVNPGLNDTLVGIVQPGQDMYAAVRELYAAGFKVTPFQDGRRIYVDVKGRDAADLAVGLARYYYITDVMVGQKVYDQLFGLGSKSAQKGNQWLTLRKISVNSAQPDANDTLVAKLHRAHNVDDALRELHINGFNARAYQSNNGSYIILVDVEGLDAADYAVGLARYYYITEVRVGQAVYNKIFGLPSAR
jgi:hypothetical protein